MGISASQLTDSYFSEGLNQTNRMRFKCSKFRQTLVFMRFFMRLDGILMGYFSMSPDDCLRIAG